MRNSISRVNFQFSDRRWVNGFSVRMCAGVCVGKQFFVGTSVVFAVEMRMN